MNVSGLGALPAAYRLPGATRTAPPAPAVPVAPMVPAAEVGTLRPAPAAPADVDAVPPGSDPALWAVLTREERSFFIRQAALGPLSYRPGQSAPAADTTAPLGQRLDVRA
jgi:hypothetical protein